MISATSFVQSSFPQTSITLTELVDIVGIFFEPAGVNYAQKWRTVTGFLAPSLRSCCCPPTLYAGQVVYLMFVGVNLHVIFNTFHRYDRSNPALLMYSRIEELEQLRNSPSTASYTWIYVKLILHYFYFAVVMFPQILGHKDLLQIGQDL